MIFVSNMLHSAYSFALDFEADLVANLLGRVTVDERTTILDPFCGTGTTLLESKLRGFPSVGVDANPVCVLVSKAKTDWGLNVSDVPKASQLVLGLASSEYQSHGLRHLKAKAAGERYTPLSNPIFARSAAGRYLVSSGLIRRGWISPRPALKTLLIAEALWKLPERPKNFLLLSLLGLLIPEISNMSYGPEIYRARRRIDCDVFGLFEERTRENLEKLKALHSQYAAAPTKVRMGDSTNNGLDFLRHTCVDAVITSPPYLSDHDYTRMTRLELVFSGYLSSREDLRKIKRHLLRSSSKNVYKDDSLSEHVNRFGDVQAVIRAVSERALEHKSGFARVYPRLVGEYFGGIYAHFTALGRVLRVNGQAAYVVGDQSSFFATRIPTARITAQLAEGCGAGFRVTSMERIRRYRGTRGAVNWSNDEWLILLKKYR